MLADYDDNISEQGWWMGCGEERGPACTKFKNVMMSVGFVKRLFATYGAFVLRYFLCSYHFSVYMRSSRFTGVSFHTNTVKGWECCSN